MTKKNSEEHTQHVDNHPTHVVGIGASAGGLEAIELFVKNLKAPTGLAYVIVQHLSPDYKSLMAELLSKFTDMPIYRIEDGMELKKDSIYLISPRKNIKVFHGKLISIDQEDRLKGQINLPIDIFFHSLAQDLGEKAIGIVFSGTGSDGTRGIRAIKESGGMTIAQEPESAKFDSMPKSAIATGLVDYVLPPEVMPQQLLNFVKHPFAKHTKDETLIPESDNGLAKIFSLLRDKHKVDFTHYKPSTIIRRIERRITVNQCNSLAQYNQFIEKHPHEITTLFQEMLIGVTCFFRDDPVFQYLKADVIPNLLEGYSRQESRLSELRIWSAGCSTGEEAYTLAMLCADYIATRQLDIKFKIFATDVDAIAIEKASIGIYPGSIAADVPPDFLSRYFVHKDEHFQIARELRECVVFAQHDLAKDPPFTNIDLISCRNLLIYFQPALQKRVLELFNFSLKSNGILLLGTSETLGEMDGYFEAVNAKLKIFTSKGRVLLPGIARQATPRSWSTMSPSMGKITVENESVMRYTEERFYNRFIDSLSQHHILPLTLVTDEQMNVSHIYGDSSEFLQYSRGKIVLDISKIVIKELSIPVTTGLRKAIKNGQTVTLSNIRAKTLSGVMKTLQVQVLPIPNKGSQGNMYSVLISESVSAPNNSEVGFNYNVGQDVEQRIADLEQELQFSRESLQATVEELETSNEELQATNEELLASNEELQSTNEELQSVNEELYTVNAEFQSKIAELTVLNTDMDNWFNSTQTAALFLDENGEIRRLTPKLKELFPIIDSDVGRPINHLSFNIGNSIDLHKIINRVMAGGVTEEHEFQSSTGQWYLLRATPYAVSHVLNAGVVLIIIDIDDLKHAQAKLLRQMQEESERLTQLIASSEDVYIQCRPDGHILLWSLGAEKLYGWSRDEALNMNIYQIVNKKEHDLVSAQFAALCQGEGAKRAEFTVQKFNRLGEPLLIVSKLTVMEDTNGVPIIISRESVSASSSELAIRCARCLDGTASAPSRKAKAMILFDEQDLVLSWSSGAQEILGWTAQNRLGKCLKDILDNSSQQHFLDLKQQAQAGGIAQPILLRACTPSNEYIELVAFTELFGEQQYALVFRRCEPRTISQV